MTCNSDIGLYEGMRATIPIGAAYLPIAFALGAASVQLGFSVMDAALWSAIMFSGANQVLLLSGVNSNVPLIGLALLGGVSSLRHVLYGVTLRKKISASPTGCALFAYGLTDEVFATALATHENRNCTLPARWLIGLAFSASGIWIIGTAVGNAVGDVLLSHAPDLSETLEFALPALFVGLTWSVISRSLIGRILFAGALSASMILFGYPELAIPAGVVPAFIPERKKL